MRNIKKAYLEGHNIMELLRDEKSDGNTINSILYSYDLQAGSYTAFFYNTEIQDHMML